MSTRPDHTTAGGWAGAPPRTVTTPPRPTSPARFRVLLRTALRPARIVAFTAALALLLGAPAAGHAQWTNTPPAERPGGILELRPFVGAYIPTGDQRGLLKSAVLTGAQASWRVAPVLAVTGTVAWSPSEDRITTGRERLDVFQYDLGVEARAPSWLRGATLDLSPFAGIGVGGRTYHYRDLTVDARTHVAGYGALGGDLGIGRAGLRVEARNYVSRFRPLVDGGDREARNDVTVVAGIHYRF